MQARAATEAKQLAALAINLLCLALCCARILTQARAITEAKQLAALAINFTAAIVSYSVSLLAALAY
jgi:hypothetical protein